MKMSYRSLALLLAALLTLTAWLPAAALADEGDAGGAPQRQIVAVGVKTSDVAAEKTARDLAASAVAFGFIHPYDYRVSFGHRRGNVRRGASDLQRFLFALNQGYPFGLYSHYILVRRFVHCLPPLYFFLRFFFSIS